MTSILKRWLEHGAPDKSYLEEDNYKILKDLLFLNKDGIVACKHKDKTMSFTNSSVLPQTELLFGSHDQMGQQGVVKVTNRI